MAIEYYDNEDGKQTYYPESLDKIIEIIQWGETGLEEISLEGSQI